MDPQARPAGHREHHEPYSRLPGGRGYGAPADARPGSAALPWIVAVVSTVAALAATVGSREVVEPTVFLFFFAAVALSAWFGGLGTGLLSTLLSAGLVRAFILRPTPMEPADEDDIIRLLLFIGVAALVSFLSGRMQRARAAFAAVIHASPLAIFSLDPAGRILGWNVAAQRMFGWREVEVLEQRLPIVPEDRQEESRQIRARVLAGEALSGFETERVTRDGRPLAVSVSTAPLRDPRGRISGVMEVVEDITERKRVSAALQAAEEEARRALERERRIATRFQTALLPASEPVVTGYIIAHTYRPALVEADVGGDFYNTFDLDGQRLVIAIGDVGGKGLDAAVLAARMQYSVAALALHEGGHPDSVIDGVRRVFEAFAGPERIATLFLAVLDRATGQLDYAGAGHEPGLLWRQNGGRVEQIESRGHALYLGSAQGPPATRLGLDTGDILVLYTDGLPDAHPCRGSELLGIDGIAALLEANHDAHPAAILSAFYDAAVRHSQGNLRDDIALLAIRRLPPGSGEGEYVFVQPPMLGRPVCPLPHPGGPQP